MTGLVLFGTFLVLMFLGIPVIVALAAASAAGLLFLIDMPAVLGTWMNSTPASRIAPSQRLRFASSGGRTAWSHNRS